MPAQNLRLQTMRALSASLLLALCACGQSTATTSTPATPSTAATTSAPATKAPATPTAAQAPVWDLSSARSWDRHLLTLMPQIDACLAKSPSTRQISFAGQYRGAVLVRMQGETTVDCRVADGLATIAPHDDALNPPGDGEALFVRAPGENPGGECYEAPEVRDANGAVLGWMLDTEGC